MFRITFIRIENFNSIGFIELDLDKRGVVLVNGVNGSGKSSIFKAIGWVVYGKSIDGEFGDKVVRQGEKCCKVSCILKYNDDKYEIVRERYKQSPKLTVYCNDSEIKRSKTELQKVIESIVCVDWVGFKNTILYGQNDHYRFVYPTTKDSEKKSMLQKILKTEIFSECFVEAKRRRLCIEKEEKSLLHDNMLVANTLQNNNLSTIKKNIEEYESNKKSRIQDIKEEIGELESKIAFGGRCYYDKVHELNDVINELKKEKATNNNTIEKYRSKISDLKKWVNLHRENISSNKTSIDYLNKRLKAIDQDRCPVCNSLCNEGEVLKYKNDLMSDRKKLNNELDNENKKCITVENRIHKIETHIAKIDHDQRCIDSAIMENFSERRSLEEKSKMNDMLKNSIERKKSQLNKEMDAVNPHIKQYKEAKDKVAKLKKQYKQKSKLLKDLGKKRSVLEFWTKGFSPSGLPSFALDSVMPFITDRANHYLNILSDGEMSINFSTQKELKSSSGEYRDEISIKWVIEGVENYPPSGGQWKKMEIATNLAIKDLVESRNGFNINILCMDECLDGLDNKSKQRLVLIFQELRKTIDSIFVISHDLDMDGIFDETITITKENGVSRIG